MLDLLPLMWLHTHPRTGWGKNVVSLQHVVRKVRLDVSPDDIHVAVAPEIVPSEVFSEDVTVERLPVANLVGVANFDLPTKLFRSQFCQFAELHPPEDDISGCCSGIRQSVKISQSTPGLEEHDSRKASIQDGH
jgi:hypothetical protein